MIRKYPRIDAARLANTHAKSRCVSADRNAARRAGRLRVSGCGAGRCADEGSSVVSTNDTAVTATSAPSARYPQLRWDVNRLATPTPATPPTTEATPVTADAAPRLAGATRSGMTAVSGAWYRFTTDWARHHPARITGTVLLWPSQASTISRAAGAPSSYGARRPSLDLVRSDSAPPTGLKTSAKAALTPAMTPSTATLCGRSMFSTCWASSTVPAPAYRADSAPLARPRLAMRRRNPVRPACAVRASATFIPASVTLLACGPGRKRGQPTWTVAARRMSARLRAASMTYSPRIVCQPPPAAPPAQVWKVRSGRLIVTVHASPAAAATAANPASQRRGRPTVSAPAGP